MERTVRVEVSKKKIDDLGDLLQKIPIDLRDLSFHQKREILRQLIDVTNNVIDERGQAFEKAKELVTDTQKATVILDSVVENLIDRSFIKQKQLINSYLDQEVIKVIHV